VDQVPELWTLAVVVQSTGVVRARSSVGQDLAAALLEGRGVRQGSVCNSRAGNARENE
jgi:hypothetical protein